MTERGTCHDFIYSLLPSEPKAQDMQNAAYIRATLYGHKPFGNRPYFSYTHICLRNVQKINQKLGYMRFYKDPLSAFLTKIRIIF